MFLCLKYLNFVYCLEALSYFFDQILRVLEGIYEGQGLNIVYNLYFCECSEIWDVDGV